MTSRTAVPGLRSPGVGFEQPFEMLEACHERVQRSLDLLARLCAHVRSQGADDSAREAARDVLRYFDIAAPLHHEDEELHVFPPLLAHAAAHRDDAAAVSLAAQVAQLQRDHTTMAAAWAQARVPLAALAAGEMAGFEPSHEAAFDRYIALHADHICHEEGAVYPAAQAVLAQSTVQSMGHEMARRRGAV
ncbi:MULTISPECIES: hemerythrin domain-containing protein [unclassified Acidovorax]|uniref:hemerythrin domain-containing protein n=1 Tax=unclassified Acidovorax TaxID=2684926 RepID=UPI0028832CCC|nr:MULTISPECIES: hemerythrin domain-containing protein [unclassified Acidovorax]